MSKKCGDLQAIVTGHHLEVTPALKGHVEKKVGRLKRHLDENTTIHVILSTEKNKKRAETTLNVMHGQFFASTEHEDLYLAIDDMFIKLERQLIKQKERVVNHRRQDDILHSKS